MFYSFSEQTKYLRYHGTLKAMPHNKVQVFCNVDYDTEMALVAVHGSGGHEEIVAVGRYMTNPAKRAAEMAFVVADDWQRKGLGTLPVPSTASRSASRRAFTNSTPTCCPKTPACSRSSIAAA